MSKHSIVPNEPELLRQIVNTVVDTAIQGALRSGEEPDDCGYYHEIDYNDVEGMLEPLTELGIRISYEKLAELLDAHPDVDYSDAHNTGVTVYLKEQAVMAYCGGSKPLPEHTPSNTLLGLMRSGVSFYNVRLWAEGGGYENSHQIHELGQSTLEKYDLSRWADVLTAPVVKLSPHRFSMTFILRDVSPQRVVDFAETIERMETQEKEQAQEPNQSDQPHMGM